MDNNENQNNSVEVQDTLSLDLFAKELKSRFKIETLKEKVRLTPKGIFIENRLRKEVFAEYMKWLQEKTQGAYGKNETKCFKRAFGVESNPPQYYLIEGKVSLLGVLMPCEIKAPQSFNIPFYLGTLVAADNYISPNDSRLEKFHNVKVVQESGSSVIEIKVKKWTYKISQELVFEFRNIIEHSKFLVRRFPWVSASMLDTIKVISNILYEAKPLERGKVLIIPQDLPKKYLILNFGELYFILNEQNTIINCYETKGPNLRTFLRNEIIKMLATKKHKISSLNFFQDKDGKGVSISVNVKGKRHIVAINAIGDFVEYCNVTNVPFVKVPLHYNLINCCEAFSHICEHVEPIAKDLIERHVEMFSKQCSQFLNFEKWILGIDRRNQISHCTEKGATKTPNVPTVRKNPNQKRRPANFSQKKNS